MKRLHSLATQRLYWIGKILGQMLAISQKMGAAVFLALTLVRLFLIERFQYIRMLLSHYCQAVCVFFLHFFLEFLAFYLKGRIEAAFLNIILHIFS